MTTFTTMDREEEKGYLRIQIRIQQEEIDRLSHKLMQVEKERNAYLQAYNKLLEDDDMDGRC
jgi:signal transduction protein with GAF and PtsI domain